MGPPDEERIFILQQEIVQNLRCLLGMQLCLWQQFKFWHHFRSKSSDGHNLKAPQIKPLPLPTEIYSYTQRQKLGWKVRQIQFGIDIIQFLGLPCPFSECQAFPDIDEALFLSFSSGASTEPLACLPTSVTTNTPASTCHQQECSSGHFQTGPSKGSALQKLWALWGRSGN